MIPDMADVFITNLVFALGSMTKYHKNKKERTMINMSSTATNGTMYLISLTSASMLYMASKFKT